jgi:phage terminase large subunit GpA-like protein
MSIKHQASKLAATIARKAIDAALSVPAPLGVGEWAERYRRLPKTVTAKAGPYTLEATPHARAPQEAFLDPTVQVTVLCWASRTGKTETLMNLTGYTIDHDPMHILWVYPTLDSAKKWSKEFFTPMVRSSPCFAGKIKDAKSRDSDNTMLSKSFPGGRVAAIGANSPSAFRQIQAPRVVCEEIDAMEAGPEGDPVVLAFKRADNYSESVQVVSSTPTVKGRSRIWAWLESSDFNQWRCPCPKCGYKQAWQWNQVKWTEGDTASAHLECEKCAHPLTDRERRESVAAGEWVATRPFAGVRGYWLNGINSLFAAKKGFSSLLHQAATEFLAAKKEGRAALRAWTNTFLAETFEEEAEVTATPDALEQRAEEYEPDALPEDVLLLVAAADVQKDRIECAVTGYGRDEESWGVIKRVFDGDPEQDEVWARLDNFLLSTFTREDGVPLNIERAFIDMGFKHQRVLSFCAPRLGRGVYPCRGLNRVGVNVPPILPSKPSRNNRARIPHWNIGVTVAKSAIYDRLSLPIPGPRAMHFPRGHGYDPEHFRQLTAEKRRTRYTYGQAYSIFEKDHSSVRNEALDLAVYSLAALYSLMPVNWEKLATNRNAARPEDPAAKAAPDGTETQPASPQVPPRPAGQMRRRNFATAW